MAVSAHLIAKLAAPRAVETVRRARVARRIDRALGAGACWIAAPAGYGKTTSIADYLASGPAPYVWFRVDEGDQDLGRFFGYLAQSLPSREAAARMPVFGVEYASEPRGFARLFFRAYFAELEPATLLVFDDLHTADTPEFRGILSVMLGELPRTLRCVCLSRTLPKEELEDLRLSGALTVLDRAVLEFSDQEARNLIKLRLKHRAAEIDVGAARGWAVGLVLLAERRGLDSAASGVASFSSALGRHFFEALPETDQEMLLTLNLLPEITIPLANAITGSTAAGELLDRLYHRQLLVTRSEGSADSFQLHDLLRDFLHQSFEDRLTADDRRALRTKAAQVLVAAGRTDDAIALAAQAGAWALARDLLLRRAETVIAEGRRATFIEWVSKLPAAELTGWLLYWAGVAQLADDAAAERWLSRAWEAFETAGDERGKCLTMARALVVKTDSWRTHEGLSTWTQRGMEIAGRPLPQLSPDEDLLVHIGLVRACDYGEESGGEAAERLGAALLERLASPERNFSTELRLHASETLIEHAMTTGRAELFEQAVDHVAGDVGKADAPSWHLGLWLVSFGAASGRFFRYSRRGFPFATAEEALRAAIGIGERELLRGVEFGALYHLQLQMKLRNDFSEFGRLVTRLAEIADSRYTTQVAVVADCHAAMHTRQGNFTEAYRDCDRFMAAIEAANEPVMERQPHYVTKFQVLLADRRPREAIELLAELVPKLHGGARQRTLLTVAAAEALQAKWGGEPEYDVRLRSFMSELARVNWRAILLNLPELLADLLGDALDAGIEAEFCRALIEERRLTPPAQRPSAWPWALKVHVLGGFRVERDGNEVELGPRPPTRALDILRILALSKDHACSLETIQDWLWPDLDGAQAAAACEQALHRLRRLLGQAELVVLREGQLRLPLDKAWVDLDDWDDRLKDTLAAGEKATATRMEEVLAGFPGPLLFGPVLPPWAIPAAERVRDGYVELSVRAARRCDLERESARARATCLRALEFYHDSDRLHGALIEQRLAGGDIAGAVEDHQRYMRMLKAAGDLDPSPAIAALALKFQASPRHA
jgi:LuxR family transcriptional regulator, maltose regulon positive regulatory protein